jgi:hypothetical protein
VPASWHCTRAADPHELEGLTHAAVVAAADAAAVCHACVHRSKLTGAQKYCVTVEPGVDAAFVVALATLCDEIFHDQPR